MFFEGSGAHRDLHVLTHSFPTLRASDLDLLSEIRRQLKPLGRQAEVARKAATVQADVRDARARLLADDLVTARTSLEQAMADASVLLSRRAEVESSLQETRKPDAKLQQTPRAALPPHTHPPDPCDLISALT